MEGAPERSKVARSGAGYLRAKKFALSNQFSRPWDRPMVGTHATLQPLQLQEDNLGSRHLLWRQRETLVDLLHSPSLPWVF